MAFTRIRDMDRAYVEALAEENDRNWLAAGGNLDTRTDIPQQHRTDVQASIAGEVAALRAEITMGWWEVDEAGRDDALARLDRIAALVPQRATAYGLELWQHACGLVDQVGFREQPSPDQCDRCRLNRPGASEPWHALYTVAGR